MLENFRIIFQHFGDNCPRSNRAREGHSGAKSTAKKAEIKAKVDHQITAKYRTPGARSDRYSSYLGRLSFAACSRRSDLLKVSIESYN